ncbi:riboflavin biosynthesis protein RibD C-terminal domain protein [Leptospira broomii serovar Hurstbridge str. 5399]|uniref:Riboflavin biosynthesis protein RibD C-terminal domain protein n=2 Tax=Leptospira broomii TaxID=301541 RepID=T0GMN2_9LEPT|nr:riboflavin biosynthesis protein RibD C-terminal domain protein [Leptospira broomii serovar Hurstbridge str. 5399]
MDRLENKKNGRVCWSMRKIIFQMMVTLDGFFEGPNDEIDWHRVDDEFNEYAVDLLGKVDTLLFGRVTYDLMAGYWPTPAAVKDDPIVAGRMNDLPKIVFSKTLNRVEWQNTKLIKDNIADEVLKLKNQSGRDMAIFGSSNLALTFIKHGLIDEFRIMVNPVVLGNGKTLFDGIDSKLNLKLVQTKIFGSGLVSLHYKPD